MEHKTIGRFQSAKNFAREAFADKKAKAVMIATPVLLPTLSYANSSLPELTIDTAGLMKAMAVVVAAISVVGMGVLTVALTAKAFKYIRTAF